MLSFCYSNNTNIDYIINCCTLGNHDGIKTIYNSKINKFDSMSNKIKIFINNLCSLKSPYNSLNDIVQESIDKIIKPFNIKALTGHHPSCWHSKHAKIG